MKKFCHHKITSDSNGVSRYTVTENHLPYKPFEEFLKHTAAIATGDGENTTKAYARNLAEFANFLHDEGYEWFDTHAGIVTSYVEWVKRGGPELGNVKTLRRSDKETSHYSPSSINQRTGAIISCFEFHKKKGSFPGVDLRTYKNALPHHDDYKSEYTNIKHKKGKRGAVNPWNQKIKGTPPPILEPEEVEFLIDCVFLLRDKLLISILYDVGLRIGEALGARISDISPQEGTISVVCRKNVNNAKVKNSAARENLKLSDKTMSLFTEYILEEYPEEIDSDYLFVVLNGETRGRPLNYINAYQLIRRQRKKYLEEFGNEKPFSPHWFRHTAGTDSMEKDTTGGRATQDLLGHALLQTTGKYVHPRPETARDRMDEIHKERAEKAEKRRDRRKE